MNKQVADQQNKTLINYVDQLVKMDEKLNDESSIGGSLRPSQSECVILFTWRVSTNQRALFSVQVSGCTNAF